MKYIDWNTGKIATMISSLYGLAIAFMGVLVIQPFVGEHITQTQAIMSLVPHFSLFVYAACLTISKGIYEKALSTLLLPICTILIILGTSDTFTIMSNNKVYFVFVLEHLYQEAELYSMVYSTSIYLIAGVGVFMWLNALDKILVE
ncbi:hypothetical protein QTV43_000472 [Vibrio vulnificus]|nr:hypothetical protein [Vibrio vulnificus]